MNNFFGENGMLYRSVTKMTSLVLLNVLFLLTCIPIVTIGAAISSLYTMTLQMCRNEESYILKSYLKAFRQNFKKATEIWTLFLIGILILGIDFRIVITLENLPVRIFVTVLLAVLFILLMVISYAFPLIAAYENTLGHTMKNSFILAMSKIGYTVPIVALNFLPMLLIIKDARFLEVGSKVYLLIGFALTAYINSYLFRNIFEKTLGYKE